MVKFKSSRPCHDPKKGYNIASNNLSFLLGDIYKKGVCVCPWGSLEVNRIFKTFLLL